MCVDILIVNSDPEIGKQLQALLEHQGHQVLVSPGIVQAQSLLAAHHADLIMADCRQLESDGSALFHSLAASPQPPMILPTACTLTPASRPTAMATEVERMQSIVAQVQHLLDRHDGDILRVGDLIIDTARKRVMLHGQHVLLPPIQFRLLAYLAQNAGRVVGARELLKAVWGYEGDEAEARELVKVHVRQIRRKLGLEAQRADYVQSVRGFGYVVTPPNASPS